jgi:Tol biopolymer transport system component
MTRFCRCASLGLPIFAALLTIALSSSTASANFPGSNGRIAFLAADTYTVRPDGTDVQPLVKGFGVSWSADGQHVAFARFVGPQRTAIFTMRADGSGERRVTHSQFNEGGPSYSPNGRRLVFDRAGSNRVAIVSVRLDGSGERVLARGLVGEVTYSPTGRRIVYTNGANGAAIWGMRPDGSHKRQLVPPDRGGYSPDYSPDGKHIVFERLSQLYVMRSDGSHRHRLDCGRGASAPQYSPNGRKLVWQGQIGHGRGASSDIFTSSLRCSDTFRVTRYGGPGRGGAYEPSWQPIP